MVKVSLDLPCSGGILIRIISKHAIAHNRAIIVDGHTVQQGSFNYTKAAEEKMVKTCW